MLENKTFAIYSRKSRFTGKGESIENQVEMCREYIKNNFGEEAAINASVYEDEGYSGKNLDRPQFQKMLQNLRANKHNAIVIYRLDRISRNVGDFAHLIDELNKMSVDFISIREQFDTSTPMGKAMLFITSTFSQLERETIAERIRDNMCELAKTGRWLGGNTPTGFASEQVTTVLVNGHEKKAYKLVPIPDEIELVKLIYKIFIETNSLSQTESYFLINKIYTKNGNYFSRFTIKAILTNPVYMIADADAYQYFIDNNVPVYSEEKDFDGIHGIMSYNKTLQETGKANKTKPMDEWIISVGKHEGIIPGHLWVSVQNNLERNKDKSFRKPRSHDALLSGILICGNCGHFMRPKKTNRKNKNGDFIYTYMCSMKERSHREICNIKNINGNDLDNFVLDALMCTDFFREKYLEVRDAWIENFKAPENSLEKEVKIIESEIKKAEKARNNLIASLAKANNEVVINIITEQINSNEEHIQDLKAQMESIEKEMSSETSSEIDEELLAEIKELITMEVFMKILSLELKRELLRLLIKEIVWDGENIYVYAHGSYESYNFPIEPIGLSSAYSAPQKQIKKGIKVPSGEYRE